MIPTAKHLAVFLFFAASLAGQQKKIKPGFNLFSKQQDIQMGQEYKDQIEKQMPVVHHAELDAFLQRIGKKLAAQPDADQYPYTFQLVNDKSINAFALPGGPTFVHTGLMSAAENEAQIAGVMAHEIAHVALRHGTNQASKAQLIQLPALLAGQIVGGNGISGMLAQLGIGLGANSVLMKFSRNAESDADLLGARIMSGAGYNPIEMARFFEKLEAEAGKGSAITQFFSDHPNPGNRVKSVENEIRQMPRRTYDPDTGQLPGIKKIIEGLPAAPKRNQQQAQPLPQGGDQNISLSRPSGRLTPFQGREVAFSHPDNWQLVNQGQQITVVPKTGVFGDQIGYGMIASFHQADGELRQVTGQLVNQLRQGNPSMQVKQQPSRFNVNGYRALSTLLESDSPYKGQREYDLVVTFERQGGVFYFVFICPASDYPDARRVFEQVVRSVRLGQ
jgi:Zn-dependent protease with chaperone function